MRKVHRPAGGKCALLFVGACTLTWTCLAHESGINGHKLPSDSQWLYDQELGANSYNLPPPGHGGAKQQCVSFKTSTTTCAYPATCIWLNADLCVQEMRVICDQVRAAVHTRTRTACRCPRTKRVSCADKPVQFLRASMPRICKYRTAWAFTRIRATPSLFTGQWAPFGTITTFNWQFLADSTTRSSRHRRSMRPGVSRTRWQLWMEMWKQPLRMRLLNAVNTRSRALWMQTGT
jgi:hypothetical protein